MKRRQEKPPKPPRVAEPVQVYLGLPDQERLGRLTVRLGATKSDILRRGLEALEAQTAAATSGSSERVVLPTFAGSRLLPGVNLDNTATLLDLMED
jgi:hypothetical protein